MPGIQAIMSQLSERYLNTLSQIKTLSEQHHTETKLLAVSKTRSSDEILEVHQLGQQSFGENYIQEAVEKVNQLKDYPIEWHFIGPLQSNKSRLAAENFQWVHTIDRLKIAKRLNDQRPQELEPLNVCIQVNIDNEATKSGFLEDDVVAAAIHISEFKQLKLRGLMAIPAATQDKSQQLATFERMQYLLEKVKHAYTQHQKPTDSLDTLSMGMSGDMESAIQCGATIVRIGTAIFGPRTKKTTAE
jgi:pyridoxal phosphate enzyme (YggS family)